MALIQKPDALTLAGNIKDIIVTSPSAVRFVLMCKGNELVNEEYSPIANRIVIQIREVVDELLQLEIPNYNDATYEQVNASSEFTATLTGTGLNETFSFIALKGGVDGVIDSASFLKTNFLTWQPQQKQIILRQPEWLTYYVSVPTNLVIKAYFPDLTSELYEIGVPAGKVVSINTNYDTVNNYFSKPVSYYDVWAEIPHGERLSYMQRYIPVPESDRSEIYVFENTLGGIDSFVCLGELKEKISTEGVLSTQFDLTEDSTIDLSIIYEQNTGFLNNRDEAKWLHDFFVSRNRYHVADGLRRIYIESQENEFTVFGINSFTFEFYYCNQTLYNSVVRDRESLPDLLEFPTPDGLFFLTPRLTEYPTASYSDDLIIPVQNPYTGKWFQLSALLFQPSVNLDIAIADYDKLGIASFAKEHFNIEKGHVSLKNSACEFPKYFYEKDGKLFCKLDFISEKGVSAYGIGPDGDGGTGVDLVDNLTSSRVDAALTANQGRILKSLIDGKASDWDSITGKPLTFTPSAHTHLKANITDFAHTHIWGDITGKPSIFPTNWANIADKPNFDATYLKLTGGTLTGDLTGKNITANGYLYTTSNGKTTKIGSNNSSYCHYETDAGSGHWFNKQVYIAGDVYAGTGYNRRLAYVDEIAGIEVNYALYAGRLKGYYTGNGGYQKPNYFGLGGRLQMMNSLPGTITTDYHDCFIMNSYISDVPTCNMIAGDKAGRGNIYLFQQNANSETWVNKGKFWHSGNSNLSTIDWNCNELNARGWIRSYGAVGWYSQTYGGGIWMTDATYLRVYGSKKFFVDNNADDAIITNGGFRSGECYYGHRNVYPSIISGGNEICITGASSMHVNYQAPSTAPQTWYWRNGTSSGWSDHHFGTITGHKMAYIDGRSAIGIGGHNVGLKLYEYKNIGINLATMAYTWGIYSNENGNMYVGRRTGNVDDSSGSYYYIFGDKLFTVNGNIVSNGEMTAYSVSDIRLKTNLRPLDGLSYLRGLQAYEFDWNNKARELTGDNRQHGFGYIAQEVARRLPEFVHNVYNSEYIGIQYEKFLPIFGASISQLDKKQSEHEKRIQALESENKQLKQQLNKLTA